MSSVDIVVPIYWSFRNISTFPFLKNKITKATTYWVKEKFIPGRFIVPEWTWPGRGTFCVIPGLSRTTRDTWSPYLKYSKISKTYYWIVIGDYRCQICIEQSKVAINLIVYKLFHTNHPNYCRPNLLLEHSDQTLQISDPTPDSGCFSDRIAYQDLRSTALWESHEDRPKQIKLKWHLKESEM